MWRGRYFEDFTVGDTYAHPFGRTITETDNTWFTLLTLNTNELHFNRQYAEQASYGKILINSCLTLALATGLSVMDVSQNAVANLGWNDVRLPHPLYVGDTLHARSEVLAVRPSASQPHAGIVRVKTEGLNQDNAACIVFERTILVYRREAAPATLYDA